MNNFNVIRKAVVDGMTTAFSDMYMFTERIDSKVNAEYLLTVNVAKSIVAQNKYGPADPYSVEVEKSTKRFTRDCFYPIKFVFGGFKSKNLLLSKKLPRVSRSGRIDIVVYENKNNTYIGKQPICAIELKGVNPQRTLVVKDLRRNFELLILEANTGKSVLDFTLFASVHAFDNISSDDQIKHNENAILKRYTKWLSEVGKLSGIEAEIIAKTVSSETLGTVYDEADELAIDTSTCHQFIVVLVTFSPKT
ncbi:hypothetical protein ABVD55_005030 [Vibrio harveyi]